MSRRCGNEIRIGLKQRAMGKRYTFCGKFNAKGYPCKDNRCKYSPCFEWVELLENTDIFKDSIYEDPEFIPKDQMAKMKNKPLSDKENPYNNAM